MLLESQRLRHVNLLYTLRRSLSQLVAASTSYYKLITPGTDMHFFLPLMHPLLFTRCLLNHTLRSHPRCLVNDPYSVRQDRLANDVLIVY